MAEEIKAPRKPRCDKGIPRKAKVYEPPMPTGTVIDAPIHVKVWLKGEAEPIEFGAAEAGVEHGFHVFTYPSEYDRYRETRVEIAVSEVRRIEITAARQTRELRSETGNLADVRRMPVPSAPTRPIIHSAKEDAMRRILESQNRIKDSLEATGSARIDSIPGITFGDNAV